MPPPVPSTSSAKSLVTYKGFKAPGAAATDKDVGQTRKPTLDQEWIFQATGGNEIVIKFDKNFVKKHLFTYSKKTDEVQKMADKLWEEAGKPKGEEQNYWLQAELAKFDAKIYKVLKARAEADLCTCGHMQADHACACGHSVGKHLTGSGNRCACKGNAPPSCTCSAAGTIVAACSKAGCKCASFTTMAGTYAAARTASGKAFNPLEGAPTSVNTCLVLDRISLQTFKDKVMGSFKNAEDATGGFPVYDATQGAKNNPTSRHLTWNFGVADAVVTADLSKAPSAWAKSPGIKVTANKTASAGTRITYTVVHCEGPI